MYEDWNQITPFEKRYHETVRVMEKYPARVPILIKKYHKSACLDIIPGKFLVPRDMSFLNFIYILQKRLNGTNEGLFLFAHGILPPTNDSIGSIYDLHHDNDGYLRITYSLENTFGKGLLFCL